MRILTQKALGILICIALVACGGGQTTTPTTRPSDTAPSPTVKPTDDSASATVESPTSSSAPAAAPTELSTTADPGTNPTPIATTGDASSASGRLGLADNYVWHRTVAEQAAVLDYDAGRIFSFVRDEIAFHSYAGVLRGAVGTLWGKAGNATDQALLLYSLLRESGYDARFARGTLSEDQARELLNSLFAPALTAELSDVPASGTTADPLNDPALLAECQDHVWVQLFGPDGWVDLDPSFPQSEMGQRITDPTGEYARLPDELYHLIDIRVRLERITAEGLTLFYPLEYQGRVADLAGQRVEFRHAVEAMGSQGGMEAAEIGRVIGAQQRRYQPVLRLGDSLIMGELFTEAEGLDLDAPVGRMAQALGDESEEAGPLSGEWLEFTLTYPNGEQEQLERVVFDRLGPSARASEDVEQLIRTDMGELLLGTHLSLLIAPFEIPVAVAQNEIELALQPMTAEHENLLEHLTARQTEGIESETRQFVLDSLLPYDVRLWVALSHASNLMMASASDDALQESARMLAVSRYYDSARVIITSLTELRDGASALSIDLRRDTIRALAHPGQDQAAELAFRMRRGVLNSALEGKIIETITGQTTLTAPAILAQAEEQGIELVALTADDQNSLSALALPQDVQAMVEQELAAGYHVLVPARFVSLGAGADPVRVAWWRIDPNSGEALGVLDTGLHQGMTFWENVILNMYLGQLGKMCKTCPTEPIDILVGFDQTLINFAGNVLKAVQVDKPWAQIKSEAMAATGAQVVQTIAELVTAGANMSAAMYMIGVVVALEFID